MYLIKKKSSSKIKVRKKSPKTDLKGSGGGNFKGISQAISLAKALGVALSSEVPKWVLCPSDINEQGQ